MRSKFGIIAIIAIIVFTPFTQAENEEPRWQESFIEQWNIDFGEVYVSTQPMMVKDTIYVRTSTSSIEKGIPTVFSIDMLGNENWNITNPNSLMQDMSPLLFVDAGKGECGIWNDMLLIAWSDGLYQALKPSNGEVIWQHQTNVRGWGITGKALIDQDTVVIPTRDGLDRLCLNGDLQFTLSTDLGWRNSPTFAGDTYWIGDETGYLWEVKNDQNTTAHFIGQGKIRHPPIAVSGSNLLIHLQTQMASKIIQFNIVNGVSTELSTSGPSPGIPLVIDDYVITVDSSYATLFECVSECILINKVAFQSNGEISQIFDNLIMMPHNSIQGGYGLFEISSIGELVLVDHVYFGDDWYGTAGVESQSTDEEKRLLVVNDNANLKYFTSPQPIVIEEESLESDWPSMLVALSALLIISTTSIQLLRGRNQSAFRFFILFCTLTVYFVFDDILRSWTNLVDDNNQGDSHDAWDEDLPDEWLGTQIIMFEFTNSTIKAGGLVGNENVLQLTESAIEELGLKIEITNTNFGKYVVSIDGKTGEGWEYYVNNQPGTVSAEYQEIQFDSIVVWKQL